MAHSTWNFGTSDVIFPSSGVNAFEPNVNTQWCGDDSSVDFPSICWLSIIMYNFFLVHFDTLPLPKHLKRFLTFDIVKVSVRFIVILIMISNWLNYSSHWSQGYFLSEFMSQSYVFKCNLVHSSALFQVPRNLSSKCSWTCLLQVKLDAMLNVTPLIVERRHAI